MPDSPHIIPDSVRVLFEKGTYFGNDSIFALPGNAAPGYEGAVLPYSMKQDIAITAIMLIAFLTLCYVFYHGRTLILNQIKTFLSERERSNLFEETAREFRYQGFLVFHASIMLGVLLFGLFLQPAFAHSLHPKWQILGLSMIGCFLFYILKMLLYDFINWVFFDKVKCKRWNEINILVISIQGLCFYAIACLCIYGNFDTNTGILSTLCVIILAKLLLFYKSFHIFFMNLRGLCHNILYLCTLEITPLLILCKVLIETS